VIKAFFNETLTYTIQLENLAIFYCFYYAVNVGVQTPHQLEDTPAAGNGYNGGLLLTLSAQESIY